jgi:peroxin-3
MPAPQNVWQRRVRRLSYLFGAGSVIYLIFLYTLDRMREARIKAAKEKKQRDLCDDLILTDLTRG